MRYVLHMSACMYAGYCPLGHHSVASALQVQIPPTLVNHTCDILATVAARLCLMARSTCAREQAHHVKLVDAVCADVLHAAFASYAVLSTHLCYFCRQ